ncbi:MAG: hypothetical protein BWY21_00172 [Parcubacteria group bacterium ADurb.Bin216]|nr:MAG: hypothetical protein BWY21_00172 [Parcubacteria group bacterium ADurb.Bin216]
MNNKYIPGEIMNIIDSISQKYYIDWEVEEDPKIKSMIEAGSPLELIRSAKFFSSKVQEELKRGREIESILPSYLVKKTLIAIKDKQIEHQDAYFFLEKNLKIPNGTLKDFFNELLNNDTIMKYLIGQYYDDVDFDDLPPEEDDQSVPPEENNNTDSPEESEELSPETEKPKKNFLNQEFL